MRSTVVCTALTTAWLCSASPVLGQKPPERPTLENLLREDERPRAVDTSSDKAKPQFAYPGGTFQRPTNGSKDPDLDKAWASYDEAIRSATALLREKIDAKVIAARLARNRDEANHYSGILDDLVKKAKLPIGDDSLKDDVAATRVTYDTAFTELQNAYKAVEEKLLKDTSRDLSEANAVANERLQVTEQRVDGQPQIPRDAIKFGKHAYYVYFGPLTQAQAADQCKKLGGYLARITEQKEFEKFHKLLLQVKKDASFWIDGTDAAKEGSWTFLDGSPLPQPPPWHTGEPNNGGRRGRDQDGLVIQVKKIGKEWDTGMDDLEQAVPAGFICEWDIVAE